MVAAIKNLLYRLFLIFEAGWERIFRSAPPAIIRIEPYLGYGTHKMLHLSGRVLADIAISPRKTDTAWRNFRNMLRRLNSWEVRYVEVEIKFGDFQTTVMTDQAGYFEAVIPLKAPPSETVYHIDLHLLKQLERTQIIDATATVMVPPPDAQFGVISDLDDTVIQSYILRPTRMVRYFFFHNSWTRRPFDGVPAFYRALQQPTHNPIFYVSSSPWNIYDFVMEFLKVWEIPVGSLFLKDYGFARNYIFSTRHADHKLAAINILLNTYPHLPFILIGDSGQHDAEIYAQAARHNPERIVAIYIRDVSNNAERKAYIQHLATELAELNVELLLVPDTAAMTAHATQRGLIPPI